MHHIWPIEWYWISVEQSSINYWNNIEPPPHFHWTFPAISFINFYFRFLFFLFLQNTFNAHYYHQRHIYFTNKKGNIWKLLTSTLTPSLLWCHCARAHNNLTTKKKEKKKSKNVQVKFSFTYDLKIEVCHFQFFVFSHRL